MQRKHFIIALIVVGVLMIASTAGMDFLWGKVLDYTPSLRSNWALDVPKDAKWETLYGSDETEDAVQCHILTYKNEEPVESMVAWTSVTAGERSVLESWLRSAEMAEEYWPVWEQCLFYAKDGDGGERLALFWDRGNVLLYVLESQTETP